MILCHCMTGHCPLFCVTKFDLKCQNGRLYVSLVVYYNQALNDKKQYQAATFKRFEGNVFKTNIHSSSMFHGGDLL